MNKHNYRILIADDEERIRSVLKIYFKDSYLVTEAKNGKEALELFKENEFDLLVLDIMMPEMDGWELIKEIRKTSQVPVIFLSARGEEYDKLFGFELGVDDYITKPFSPKVLMAKINALLNRLHTSTNVIEYKKLTINDDSKQIFLDDVEMTLTPKEYDILFLFVTNQNKVFSREVISNKIWGLDHKGDLRTVDTHIKQIRNKLGKENNYIKTVWGKGYVLR